jgi:hypothetical protein
VEEPETLWASVPYNADIVVRVPERHGPIISLVADQQSKPPLCLGSGRNQQHQWQQPHTMMQPSPPTVCYKFIPIISKREFGEPQRPQNKIVGDFPLGVAWLWAARKLTTC